MALSLRLRILRGHYHQHQSVWDIGCDHGHLGLSFLGESSVGKIHLVDPSPLVMKTLKQYIDSYITKGKDFIELHEKRGQDIAPGAEKKIVFIAGMGGKEIESISQHLLKYLTPQDDLVISPHRDILQVREKLTTSPFFLADETLVLEDGRFYQILSLRLSPGGKVHPYGEKIFQGEIGEQYRQHQINTFTAHKDERSGAYVAYLNSLTPRILLPR